MTLTATDEYTSYEVPRESDTALIAPAMDELLALLQSPPCMGEGAGVEFCGKALAIARRQAREEVYDLALQYTSQYRNVSEPARDLSSTPMILSGHQPELFHAGVWFKNFLLHRLAAESGAIAINFLVDNDLCRGSAIRVPARGASDDFVAQSVLFDSPRDAVPWELRQLQSPEVWEAFPRNVAQSLLPMRGAPLLDELWPDALAAARRTDRIGLAIAEARHRLEERIGLRTLEVPLSQLVSTRAFARFSIQLLAELPRFQDVYNGRLEHYRLAHRIRSHAHPVPALEQEDGWLEAPWWIYRAEAPKRQRMWVRVLDDQLILGDRAGWQAVIEGRLDCDNAASQWLDLLADGICIRPRALLTTMYLRMLVGDLFLHGIGGGKYDQLTNAIVREFFGTELAPMAVATATLQLPIDVDQSLAIPSLRELEGERSAERQTLWQWRYHADRNVEALDGEARALAERKRELLANIPPRGEKWRWHREITDINRRLGELSNGHAAASRERLDAIAVQERYQRILHAREYSFCLYPLDDIAPRLEQLAR